jgi:hypothetical protein
MDRSLLSFHIVMPYFTGTNALVAKFHVLISFDAFTIYQGLANVGESEK